jgi:RNAse (barnase) inhibitor barstar
MASKPVFEIDGASFDTLEGFYDEVGKKLGAAPWGRNLDAFNDILRGGFGTPEGGFILRWTHSDRSRVALGFDETVRYVEAKLRRCHPSNTPSVQQDLEAARRGEGQTLFEILIEIIRRHGEGGAEHEDGVELELLP